MKSCRSFVASAETRTMSWLMHVDLAARPRFAGTWLLPLFLAIALTPPTGSVFASPGATSTNADLIELPLETLMEMEVPRVYGASKFEQLATAAPSSVTVVGTEEIKRFGYRTLADVLSSAQGFHVSEDRNYAFLGVRGMSLGDFNSRVLVTVNGHRMNSSVTDGAHIDTGFILDVDLIDRVEIIRGPGSALYGNNAFFGVINVVTRSPSQINGLEYSAEYGEFDTYTGRLTYGKEFTNGLQMLISGTLYDSAGADRLYYEEFDTPAQNHGIAEGKDDTFAGNVFGTLSYSDFTLEGGYISREKQNPTAQYGTTFNDSRLRTLDERSYVTLRYDHEFPGVFDVSASVSYDRSDYRIGYPFSIILPGASQPIPTAYYRETDSGEWFGTELQLKKELWDRHILSLGGEYKNDFNLEQRTSDATTGEPIPGGSSEHTRESYGVYAQGDFELRTNIHVNVGTRYDQYGEYSSRVSPRAALIYAPLEKTTLKAIYGTAFRAPNFWELSYSGFKPLEPEEITGYELVLEQGIGKNLRASVSGFYNEMDHLLAFLNGSFTNFDASAKGSELAVEGIWGRLRARASYTIQTTENRSGDFDLPDSPEHLLKLNLSLPLWADKVFGGIEVQYTSSRRSLHETTDSSGQPLTTMGETASGFPVVNLTLFSRELVRNLELSVSLYNVFDEKYSDPASHFHTQDLLQRDGRTFRVKLAYGF